MKRRRKRSLRRAMQERSESSRADESAANSQAVKPRIAEQLLIERLSKDRPATLESTSSHVLTTTLGRAQLAAELAATTAAAVDCWMLDQYEADLALRELADSVATNSQLRIVCQADPPELPYDLCCIPLGRSGNAELARDLLQSAALRVRIGGELFAAVDNRDDQWLGNILSGLPGPVRRSADERGVVYVWKKDSELEKVKSYRCEFAFRDEERLIRLVSRPGVFSHRRIDPAARHVINAMQIEPNCRVLDIGCGSGTISLAAASRDPTVHVCAIDSAIRAVDSTREGAMLNGLDNVEAHLIADGDVSRFPPFDLVLANPPYFAQMRIAELFLQTAHRALKPGGRLVAVGKHPQWFAENTPLWFRDVTVDPVKGYFIVQGIR